ncbi:hypothetical protein BDV10DRAFT_189080 [Aspergillus recurvatus]
MPPELGQSASADQQRKRRRPVISCLRCREKKLRCDRVAPCGNCTKAGCPSDCVFQQTSNESNDGAKRPRLEDLPERRDGPVEGAGIGIIEDLQRRLKRIEDMLSLTRTTEGPLQGPSTDASRTRDDGSTSPIAPFPDVPPYPGTLVVKGTRTQYHGQNNRISLLSQFPDAKDFLQENCNMDSPIFRLAKEIQFLQGKTELLAYSPASTPELELAPELQQLRDSLPPREVCDRLVDLYTTNLEKAFRILHIPTFRRQYHRFQDEYSSDGTEYSAFLPQLTAVLAAAFPFLGQGLRKDYPDVCDYLRSPALSLVRSWLQKLGRKQRTELAAIQTEAVVLLARQLRRESPEELWRATGGLVRSAMVMGLHLDLSKCANLSAFQKETRRRLWITIVEMELQASIASGMPVTVSETEFGPLIPTNLDDIDYDEPMTELPPGKPTSEWTDSLTQTLLAGSLRKRIQTMSFIRTGPSEADLTTALGHAQELEELLRRIKAIPSLAVRPRPSESPALLLNSVLLDLYIRRPLICLYAHILQCRSYGEQFRGRIENALLESALAVLSYQDYFDPAVASSDVLDCPTYWALFLIFCKNDFLRAALSVCQYITLSPSTWPTNHTKASLVCVVQTALGGLTRSFCQPGSNMKDVLLLSLVLQLVRARGMGDAKEEFVREGVVDALSGCRSRLLSYAEQPIPPISTEFEHTFQKPQSTSQFADMSTLLPQLPDFLGDPSTLAAEFDDFMTNPFTFDGASLDAFFTNF